MSDDTEVNVEETRMEEMTRTGEIEFTANEPEEKPLRDDTGNVTDDPKYVIDGNEYSADEVKSWMKDSQNKAEWEKANTLMAQSIAEEKKELVDKYSPLKEQVKGDDVLESLVAPISEIDKRLEAVEKREEEIKQREAVERKVDLMVADAEKRLGVKFDRNSDEFKELANMTANDNPLYHAYLARNAQGKAQVPVNLKPATDSEAPEVDGYSAKEISAMKDIARKAGISWAAYKKNM